MGSRLMIAGVSVVVLLGVYSTTARSQQNPYRLKETDQKKLCLTCHTDFEEILKKPFVHTAVQSGECSGCHDPHGSSHGQLLSVATRQLCASCHDTMIPAGARSAHKVVADGECTKCHDPHASNNRANLLAAGNDLCVGCHKALGDAVAKAKFKHAPVGKGCVNCHDPHGSAQSAHLLKSAVPALCLGCHKPDAPAFVAAHMKYPVAKADCTSCHDPHGSDQTALLLNDVHPPLASRMCDRCHERFDSATPFATRLPGYELCRECHGDMVKATLAKPRLHWPVADRKGCVNCHSPHASRQGKLLKAETPALCGSCHADTLQRIAAVPVKHEPVAAGTCLACHSPHSSDGVYLFNDPSVNKLCTACHDYAAHSAHPIGEKAIDPRNKNLRVDCLSCHKGHGTEYQRMLLAATNVELCTRCHKQFAR
jgi:predicted CXXCH cytochrome family protein